MGKIIYYSWVGISLVVALPLAFLIILLDWLYTKYQKLTCKKCGL